ncbi:MAG: HEAT repeat domain-containing protein [Nitrospinae bacterium]|nr:HEAT repeat domain-containing protein [Nitrospinota bacterium]
MSTMIEDQTAPGVGALTAITAQLVGSGDFHTRYWAVKSLPKLAGAAAVDVLLSIAENAGEDPDLRIEALTGLGGILPSGEIGRIAAFLKDPVPDMRVAAAAILAKRPDEATVEALLEVISGEEPDGSAAKGEWNYQWDAQLHALKALAAIGPARAVAPLIEYHEREQSRDMAVYVFKALLKASTPAALQFSRDKLRRGLEWERRSVCDAARAVRATELNDDLRLALLDRDRGVRMAAAAAVAENEGARAHVSLFLLLNDPDAEVRGTAVEILARLGALDGHENHVSLLLRDPVPSVRAAVIDALGAWSTPAIIKALQTAVRADEDETVAARAAIRLAALDAGGSYDVLAGVARDPSRGALLRARLIAHMRSAYPDRAEAALLPCLDTEPRQVAVAAAAALIQMGSQKAADILITKVREALTPSAPEPGEGEAQDGASSPDGQAAMIGGKKAVGGARTALTTQTLVECLSGSSQELACAAAEALGRVGDPTAGGPLREALKSDSAQLRLRALTALRALEDAKALPLINDVLAEDPDETVRAAAAEALWPADSPDTVARLISGLSDPSLLTRRACVAALGRVAVDRKHVAATLYYVLFDFPRFGELRSAIHEALRNLDQKQTILSLAASTLKNPECRNEYWVALETIGELLA